MIMSRNITDLADATVEELKKLEELKPERGIIEDFFKVAKDAFGLGKFHSYTEKSMVKNILLGFLLTTIVVQCVFKTKTQLQRLSEGYMDFEPPKIDKKKQKDDENKIENESTKSEVKQPKKKTLSEFKENLTNLFNFSSRRRHKSKTKANYAPKESQNTRETIKHSLTEKLTWGLPNYNLWGIHN